jgi:hypothetical protein
VNSSAARNGNAAECIEASAAIITGRLQREREREREKRERERERERDETRDRAIYLFWRVVKEGKHNETCKRGWR